MQIEVRNLIIIAAVLFIVGLIFMLRKKIMYFLIILSLVAICVIRAGKILYTINEQQKQLQIEAEYTTEESPGESPSFDIDIDIDGTINKGEQFIEGTVDEALPNDLYYIVDEKTNDSDTLTQGLTQGIKDFVGDAGK